MNRRTGAIVLLGVAAVGLAVALLLPRWFRQRVHLPGAVVTATIGVWGNGSAETCGEAVQRQRGSQCVGHSDTLSWSDMSGARDKAWLLFGRFTMIAGLLSVVLLLGCGGLLLSRHPLVAHAWLAALIGVGTTLVFGGLYLGLQPKAAGPLGASVFLFFPAAVAGIFGALLSKDALSAATERPLPGINR